MRKKIVDQSGRPPKIALFGHFGGGNFGNEATLQAMLTRIRQSFPKAQLVCISTFPNEVSEAYKIAAVPVSETVIRPWKDRGPFRRLLRRILVGVPNELYGFWRGVRLLRRTDLFMIVGTGLLTDAFGLRGWGPYNLFRWTLLAKLCGCRIVVASVGAGPISRRLGKLLIRVALSLADFRSYRDQASRRYLEGIGFHRCEDGVFPDLAFSLSLDALRESNGSGRVVGLGVMEYRGMYPTAEVSPADYDRYIEALTQFATWLLARGYDLRLLIGDVGDTRVQEQLGSLLREQIGDAVERRVRSTPAHSTAELLRQIGETDFVVATRFHNVLLSLLVNKPVMAISFHPKCSSLMRQMGLSEYCLDIQKVTVETLSEQFGKLRQNAGSIMQALDEKIKACRDALDEQYEIILNTTPIRD